MANPVSDTSDASEIAAVNDAAIKEQADATATGKVTDTPASSTVDKSTDSATKVTTPAFDAQKSYDELVRSHKELQKFSTQTSQERSELRKELQVLRSQQEQFLKMLSKATEAPFDIEAFKRDFDQKGPKALDSYINQAAEVRETALRERYDKEISDMRNDNLTLRTAVTVFRLSGDEENHPNFTALYPKMLEIAKADNCPVNMTEPVEDVLESLYNLAKVQSSEQAVKLAAEDAKKRAELEAARESKTTVATGGKKGMTTTPDLENMPMQDLEKFVVQMHGIAEQ